MRRHAERSSLVEMCCRPVCTPKTVMARNYLVACATGPVGWSVLTGAPSPNETRRMPRAVVNQAQVQGGKIELEYETIGSSSDPAVLLVMGFTAQLTLWPDGFCRAIADAG